MIIPKTQLGGHEKYEGRYFPLFFNRSRPTTQGLDMRIKTIILLVTVVGIVCSDGAACRATVYYVDYADGNDTMGNGQLSSPWKTITRGLKGVSDGDIIECKYGADGRYAESIEIDANSANKAVTVRRQTGEDRRIYIKHFSSGCAVRTADVDYGDNSRAITFEQIDFEQGGSAGNLLSLCGKSLAFVDCNFVHSDGTVVEGHGNVNSVSGRTLTFNNCKCTLAATDAAIFAITDGKLVINGGSYNNLALTGQNKPLIWYSGTEGDTNCISVDVNGVTAIAKYDAVRITPEGGLDYLNISNNNITTNDGAVIFDDNITSIYFNNNTITGDDNDTYTNVALKAGDTTYDGFGHGWATDALEGIEFVQANNNKIYKIGTGLYLLWDLPTDYVECLGNHIELDPNYYTKGGIVIGAVTYTEPAHSLQGGLVMDNEIVFTDTVEPRDRSEPYLTDRTNKQNAIQIGVNCTGFLISRNRVSGASVALRMYGYGNSITDNLFCSSTGVFFDGGSYCQMRNNTIYGDGYGNNVSLKIFGATPDLIPIGNTIENNILDASGGSRRNIKFWEVLDEHWSTVINYNCYRKGINDYIITWSGESEVVKSTLEELRDYWANNNWNTPDANIADNDSNSILANPVFIDSVGGDFHLSGFSPCIDIGDISYSPALGETDIDGEQRVVNNRIDIGADEFLPADYPAIELLPATLEFFASAYSVNPPMQILLVHNTGSGVLHWEITEDCHWLEAYPGSGESDSIYDINEVRLSVDITDLSTGTYNCQLTISDSNDGNSVETVTVDLRVFPFNLKLDYNASAYAYAHGSGNDSREILDNSINEAVQAQTHAGTYEIEECNQTGIERYRQLSFADCSFEAIYDFNGTRLVSLIKGRGQGLFISYCHPENNQMWQGGGDGNAYTWMSGTIDTTMLEGPSASTLSIDGDIFGNSQGEWDNWDWMLKIWGNDPNAPLAVINDSNLSAKLNVRAGQVFNIEFYHLAGSSYWPQGGLESTININLDFLPIVADLDKDGDIDLSDFAILAWQWLDAPRVPSADIAPAGGDDVIDVLDLRMLADNWLAGS
jgi:hypothetical protein